MSGVCALSVLPVALQQHSSSQEATRVSTGSSCTGYTKPGSEQNQLPRWSIGPGEVIGNSLTRYSGRAMSLSNRLVVQEKLRSSAAGVEGTSGTQSGTCSPVQSRSSRQSMTSPRQSKPPSSSMVQPSTEDGPISSSPGRLSLSVHPSQSAPCCSSQAQSKHSLALSPRRVGERPKGSAAVVEASETSKAAGKKRQLSPEESSDQSRPEGSDLSSRDQHGKSSVDPERTDVLQPPEEDATISPDTHSDIRKYELIIIQEPVLGAAFGSNVLARIACQPPLILQVRVTDHEGREVRDTNTDRMVCQLSLLNEDGEAADLLAPFWVSTSRAATDSEASSTTPTAIPSVPTEAAAISSDAQTTSQEMSEATTAPQPETDRSTAAMPPPPAPLAEPVRAAPTGLVPERPLPHAPVRMLYGTLVATPRLLRPPPSHRQSYSSQSRPQGQQSEPSQTSASPQSSREVPPTTSMIMGDDGRGGETTTTSSSTNTDAMEPQTTSEEASVSLPSTLPMTVPIPDRPESIVTSTGTGSGTGTASNASSLSNESSTEPREVYFVFPEVCVRSQGRFKLRASLLTLPAGDVDADVEGTEAPSATVSSTDAAMQTEMESESESESETQQEGQQERRPSSPTATPIPTSTLTTPTLATASTTATATATATATPITLTNSPQRPLATTTTSPFDVVLSHRFVAPYITDTTRWVAAQAVPFLLP